MAYTSIRGKETVEHVESDTWTCKGRELRLHTYACKACGASFTWTHKPYERCPWCGMPVYLYRSETR